MSSLDSTINSLSATSIKDIYEQFFAEGGVIPEERQLFLSRVMTVFWGVVCVGFSFIVGDISPSIIESVNKIGSLANGPILALFLLGILTRRANSQGAVVGLLAGFGGNVALWILAPKVSWLWWNVLGFAGSFVTGYLVSLFSPRPDPDSREGLVYYPGIAGELDYKRNWPRNYAIMAVYAVVMIGFCMALGPLLGG